MIGRIFWWCLDRLYDFGKASLAGIVDAQPAVWPECQIDGCHEEATCRVGRASEPGEFGEQVGRNNDRIMACFEHGRQYLGVG